MTILVIGSFMMDQVVSTPRAPKNGETIIGHNVQVIPGGKGANQAVTAARLGSKVIMAGKVGNDQYGQKFINLFRQEKILTDYIEIDSETPTGIGFVIKEMNGNNRIIVISGANLKYDNNDLKKLNFVDQPIDIVMFQLEMNFSLTEEAIDNFYKKNIPILLNPAPARKLSKDLLGKITYLTPNESELELLTGKTIESIEDAINASKDLLKCGVQHIIVTLGDKGALIVNKELVKVIPGLKVKVVDTVAAGDAFNGALANMLSKGMTLEEAVEYANIAGALTVTKHGAIPSLPSLSDILSFNKHMIENIK